VLRDRDPLVRVLLCLRRRQPLQYHEAGDIALDVCSVYEELDGEVGRVVAGLERELLSSDVLRDVGRERELTPGISGLLHPVNGGLRTAGAENRGAKSLR